jgi:phytanoyl-CoA hydroxylase
VGDALFFPSRLFHAAGRNASSAVKFSLVFTYRAADNPPVAGTRSAASPEIFL